MSRRIPTHEVFALNLAAGLTKQTYGAVVAAAEACAAAEADLASAIADAIAGPLAPLADWFEAMLIEQTRPELLPLWTLVNTPVPVAEDRRSGECFPVATWLAIAAKTRRHAARIRREMADLAERKAA